MREHFFEFYPLSKDELEELWKNGLFVFDTNVLLNLYRYSIDTSNKFLEIILQFKNRLWLPFQVGLEFHRNRLIVISEQKKKYEELEKKISDIILEIENRNRNPFLSDDLFKKFIGIKNEIKNEIDNKILDFENVTRDDYILEKLTEYFDGKIGESYDQANLIKLYAEGEKRYKEKTPPGYCDEKKPNNGKYGDLIIWKQIISKSKSQNLDIVFILDDEKEDWWLEHQGKTISPRPELSREFRSETGRVCHFYKPFQFLQYASDFLGGIIKIEENIISEVKNYKSEGFYNEFIQINLMLKTDSINLSSFINEIKNNGYNIYTELSENDDLHKVVINLPNIPDLERRLNVKYLSNLEKYNIELIDKVKK
ncbi:MAG: PIN-like domain-containing protein [Microscillaceae bacterium]|jgi:hypothetical protein|nr:PIN-like domain-containing protein [Microscillaceae bacterium]